MVYRKGVSACHSLGALMIMGLNWFNLFFLPVNLFFLLLAILLCLFPLRQFRFWDFSVYRIMKYAYLIYLV